MEPRAERIRYLIGGAERGGEYGDVAYSSAPAFFGGASLAVRALIDMMTRQLAILDDAQRSPLLLGCLERRRGASRRAAEPPCGLSGCDEKSRAFLEEKGRAQKTSRESLHRARAL